MLNNIENIKLWRVINKQIIDIGGTTRVSDIPGKPEQQIFLLVKSKLPPGSKIIYEAERFEIIFEGGYSISTAPDLKIIRPCGTTISVEMTLAENLAGNGGKDPKERQKWIMSHFPDRPYVVLYKRNCNSIERHNPNISFRHSTRIRV